MSSSSLLPNILTNRFSSKNAISADTINADTINADTINVGDITAENLTLTSSADIKYTYDLNEIVKTYLPNNSSIEPVYIPLAKSFVYNDINYYFLISMTYLYLGGIPDPNNNEDTLYFFTLSFCILNDTKDDIIVSTSPGSLLNGSVTFDKKGIFKNQNLLQNANSLPYNQYPALASGPKGVFKNYNQITATNTELIVSRYPSPVPNL